MENRIINTARDLYFRYGIRSVTLDDIAKELGISKKTIYQFFKDKDELVNCVVDLSVFEEICRSKDLKKQSLNPIEEIIISVRMMKDMLDKINVVLFYDLEKYHPAAFEKYKAFKSNFLELIRQNLVQGVAQKLYRAEINIEVLVKFRLETVDMLFDASIFPPDKFKLADTQMELTDHFLRGIVTPLGLEIYEKTKLEI